MIILGIDPGSRKSGYGVIEVIGKKMRYIDSGVMRYNADLTFLDRIEEIRNQAQEILINYRPDEIAMESLIYVKSPTALIKLAQARGVILSNFIDTHLGKIYEYSPNLIKSSSVGHGHADKESVQKFLHLVFNVDKFATDDESDALAVAYCHAIHRGVASMDSYRSVKKIKGGSSLKNALSHKISEGLK